MPANTSHTPPPACGQCAEFHYPSLPDFCSTDIYTRLSSTNEPISDIDRRLYAKEILSKVHEGVDVLASRREQLRAIVHQLEQEQARMQDVLTKCRGVLSPLRCLPQEILTEIFHFSCVGHSNILDTSEGPWCLAQVCRRWRNIVVSTPLLWARLECSDAPGGKDVALKDSLPILRRALAFSGEVPLDVTLYVDDLDTYVDNAYVKEIHELWMKELMSVAERWRHLSLQIYQDMIPLLDTVRGRLPLLETLELNLHPLRVSGESVTIAFAADAPSLKRVKLANINPLQYEVDIPLSPITRMERTWVDFDEDMLLAVPHNLSACPHLTHLRMTHPFTVWPRDSEATVLRHTALRTLIISDERLLDMLELPCLEELYVKAPAVFTINGSPQPCPPDMLPAIVNLLYRSKCSLKILRIVDLIDVSYLLDILALTPELTALKLKYSEWSLSHSYDVELDALLRQLVFSEYPELVPKLTSFIIHIDSTSTYDMKRTVDFINSDLCYFLESRYRANNEAARLQKVEILFRFDAEIYNIWTNADIKWLLKLKQDGLNVSICTMGGTPNLGYTVQGSRKVYV